VLVNGPNQIFIDRGAGLELTDLRFPGEGDVRRLAQRLAVSVGRRLDASPYVEARLRAMLDFIQQAVRSGSLASHELQQ
jgi:pilus assembly protein CpaF